MNSTTDRTSVESRANIFTPPAGRKYLFTDDRAYHRHPGHTWQKWRSLKKGPPCRKLGGRPAYDPLDVQKWEEAQKVMTE